MFIQQKTYAKNWFLNSDWIYLKNFVIENMNGDAALAQRQSTPLVNNCLSWMKVQDEKLSNSGKAKD